MQSNQDSFYKDMTAVSSQYHLTEEQIENGNLDQKALQTAILHKTIERDKLQKFQEDQGNITDNSDSILKLDLDIKSLNDELENLNFAAFQAENYNREREKFKKSIELANYHIKEHESKASNDYKSAWSSWFDAKKHNYVTRFHKDTQSHLHNLLRTLTKDEISIAKKTTLELTDELFIMQTLTKAYNLIHLLVLDHRCCSFTMTDKPDINVDLRGFNSGYIRVKSTTLNEIYYVNKRQNVVKVIPLSDSFNFREYDEQIPDTSYPYELTTPNLQDIRIKTGHVREDQGDVDFQIQMTKDLLEVHNRCANFQQSGNVYLRYIGAAFALFTVLILVMAAFMVGMYLGGGTATAIITAALAAFHATQLLASIVTLSGISLSIVAPAFLSSAGVVAATSTGLVGYGFWRVGADKNELTIAAREASNKFLSIMPQVDLNIIEPSLKLR